MIDIVKPNWLEIKKQYIKGNTSYRKLAKDYNVPFTTLKEIARREQWVKLRAQATNKADTMVVEKIAEINAKTNASYYEVLDELLSKIGECAKSTLDPTTLKSLTSAMRDIMICMGIKSEADRAEQTARIAKLQREAQAEETDSEIKVTIEGDLELYSK